MKNFIVKQGLTIGMMVEDETDICYLVNESKEQMLKLDELVANQLICVESAIMNKNASLGLNTIELFAQ